METIEKAVATTEVVVIEPTLATTEAVATTQPPTTTEVVTSMEVAAIATTAVASIVVMQPQNTPPPTGAKTNKQTHIPQTIPHRTETKPATGVQRATATPPLCHTKM